MLGVAAAVVAALAFSINAPLARSASLRGVDPGTLVAIRNAVALAALLPLANFDISPAALAVVVASAVLGPGVGDYAYFKAISHSGVATAVTIGYTYIFTAQIFSAALGVEHPTIYTVAGGALAFMGILVALGGRPTRAGVVYGAVASIHWGLASTLLGLVSKEATPYTIAALRSAALLPIFLPLANFKTVSPGGVFYAVASGLVGLTLGSLAFIYAIAHIGVAATVIATSMTPVLSQIFDRAINRTAISPKHILGAALVSAGVVVAVMNN